MNAPAPVLDRPADADNDGRAAAPAPPPKKIRPRRRTLALMALVAAAGIGLILWAWNLWPFQQAVASTEDAYVRGQVTALAPRVGGYVAEVLVSDFDTVRAGQPLLRLDDRIYRSRVQEAEAALAQARARLAGSRQAEAQNLAAVASARADRAAAAQEAARAQAERSRYERLAARQLVAASDRDRMRTVAGTAQAAVQQADAAIRMAREAAAGTRVARDGLAAEVEMAQAQLALARIDLENTVILAPRAGRIGEASVRAGQYVDAGSQLMFLVPDALWVTANFKEHQTWGMHPGQPATLRVDAFGGRVLRGHVERLAPATGSEFSLLRADNASGNFTKVVQRLPVRIAIDPDQPLAAGLRPGMSVVATVELDDAPAS
ncbi:HlyD family secretion protein [Luteimonas sp. Y-2-2-4F]|nr:HlyD family secretion protein [Luteimonas sp. Y-2-2-4F]MCD9032470.1 HlyD family secretion protein [Luteimonas sp. Y-2-2-4F]